MEKRPSPLPTLLHAFESTGGDEEKVVGCATLWSELRDAILNYGER